MAKISGTVYSRKMYIERIKPFMRTNAVKVMIGPRRVGKSYILYQLINMIKNEEPDANIIYINKEDLEFEFIADYRDLDDYVKGRLKENQRNYIFVDEIQEIDHFWLAIRSLALDNNNDIYVTGNQPDLFSSDTANKLGGRYVAFSDFQPVAS